MRRPVPLMALGACLLAVQALAPSPAAALFGSGPKCTPTWKTVSEASRVITRVNARIETLERTIYDALVRQTGQQSGYMAQSAKAVTTALDSHAAVRAQTERDAAEVRAQVARRPSRSACTVTTGAEGLGQARLASTLAGRAASISETGRIAGDRATGSAPAASTDSAERYRRILERWCSPDRAPLQSAACSGAPEDHGADLRPDSLFGVETFASERELQAAIDLSRNLTVPAVEDPEPLGAVDSASERARIMASRAAAARRALAAEALGHLRALRAPGPELGAWAAAVDPDRDPDAAVSRLELVDVLAAKRFERTAWWTELQSMGGEALLRETASLLAASLLLDRERFRLEERRLAIEAAMLAAQIDSDRRVAGRAGAN
ncbi:MAG: hypothetical protein OXE57_15535 [Alphaproteobacteria bacterium]|nr:hypothetical protein [Alphaproteobacteria bacterium]